MSVEFLLILYRQNQKLPEKAMQAFLAIREGSAKNNPDGMSLDEINEEIRKIRYVREESPMKKRKSKKFVLLIVVIMFGMSAIHLPVVNASGKTTKTKAVYTIKKYSDTFKESGDKVTAVYSYQLPQLSGNSKVVKKINASLKKDYKESLKSKERCFQSAKEMGIDSAYPFYTQTTCKISYNKNGYVSFKYHSQWFAGSTGNTWTYGMTYNLKTGKKCNVSDVISGGKNAVKQKITDKYCKKIEDWEGAREGINEMKISDFQFYLKNGNVVVCFGPYQPGGGKGETHITLKGNYE